MNAKLISIFAATALLSSANAQGAQFQLGKVHLSVALVQDPDFPPLDEALIKNAMDQASASFAQRFDVAPPTLEVVNHFTISGFLGAYSLPIDPRCKPLYAARYRGGGEKELARHKDRAMKFLKRWPIDSLKGFIKKENRAQIKTHEDIYSFYLSRYVKTVDSMKGLKTPAGSPLVEPGRSAKRSFVAWTCALLRQEDYDIILTNAFILADLSTEPHPHAVFGKAKIGGIAAQSPKRVPLGGQALLATTFGIDTKLPQFAELTGAPPTLKERTDILGVYLLAHEIAHAIFGIPDVFDHPAGCLMTSRPGASYRDGLKELEQNQSPCPKCRPYVEARSYLDRGLESLEQNKPKRAVRLLSRALKKLPKHFHGGRKKRASQILVALSKAYQTSGKQKRAKKYAKAAVKFNPRSVRAEQQLNALITQENLTQLAARNQKLAITVSRTSTKSTESTKTSTATVAP